MMSIMIGMSVVGLIGSIAGCSYFLERERFSLGLTLTCAAMCCVTTLILSLQEVLA